jgi:DNA gyrase subunit A
VGAGGLGIVKALEALSLELKDVRKETLELKEELKEEMKKETLGLKEEIKKETLGLKEELSAQIALTGYNASHALTMVSKEKLNHGALFRVHDESGAPLFCGFFVDERVALTISHQGYAKRVPLNTYRAQGRGGKGIRASDAMGLRPSRTRRPRNSPSSSRRSGSTTPRATAS